jgi:hypothetical protein
MDRKLPAYMTEILLEKGVKIKQTNKQNKNDFACNTFSVIDSIAFLEHFIRHYASDTL